MDLLMGTNVAVTADKQGVIASGISTETILYVVVALVVLLEHQRRAGAGPAWGSWNAGSARRLLKECAPEAALLLSCLTLAALLRTRGDAGSAPDAETQETWEQIKSEWPLLITADTLLSLQAMLRLVVLVSLVIRSSAVVPLAQEAAALSLFGGIARVGVSYLTEGYALDGPLGGRLPVACEVAALPILLMLSWRALRRSFIRLTLAVAAVGFYASRNYLALSADGHVADSLFIAAHAFDILAAFVYLGRATLVEATGSGVSIGFTHLLMSIQQGFSAYFFLEAFDFTDDLIGAGRPFDVLHAGAAAALGAYLAAGALFAAERFDGDRPVTV